MRSVWIRMFRVGIAAGACAVFLTVIAFGARAQVRPPGAGDNVPAQEATTDPLGRTTPRGTVLGFLNAARKGENELARQYLNTRLSAKAAEDLAQELFAVLDARLPPRLDELSDAPEGSRANPLTPNLDLVGTISGPRGDLDITVERVERGPTGAIWLFSSRTLDSIPEQYDEVMRSWGDVALPRVLTTTRVAGVRLFEWLAVLLGIPVFYFATVLLNRVLTALIGVVWRWVSKEPGPFPRNVLPIPARLLLLSLASGWLLSGVRLSLLLRQFWSTASSLIAIVAIVWLLILLSGEVEQYLRRRLQRADVAAATLLLRLARRTVDVLVIFAGLLATLRLFAIDATPALAGLGVGGIAVALAAQKTLENVIAGASLIFDQAVRVGDTLKMGEVFGTVDQIGLRSTRIRTLDRTIVSIPNGQIANATLETISARDKFWFHPVVALRRDTTPDQMHDVVNGIRRMLEKDSSVDTESVRVRFFRLGAFSLDVEVVAYLFVRDWDHFLEIQERLLFNVTEIVSRAGSGIAIPPQPMSVAAAQQPPAADFRPMG
jgi:MscS family membrane protein